ncbi:MAG: nucleotide exchange factor GrpE [Thermodesulfobacteriota bacterium]
MRKETKKGIRFDAPMILNFFKKKDREQVVENALEEIKSEVIEELKDLKKIIRRQGLQLEVLKKGLQENQSEKERTAKRLLEISEAFFHLEKSLKQESALYEAQSQAFEMVWERLESVLDSWEATVIRGEGGLYDPRLYEAIETHSDSGSSGLPRVKEVLLPGYLIQGKVVKAAKAIIEQ